MRPLCLCVKSLFSYNSPPPKDSPRGSSPDCQLYTPTAVCFMTVTSSPQYLNPHPEHLVQFYESDDYLLNSLSSYIGTGLRDGEVAIVVAKNARLDALGKSLLDQGIDVPAVVQAGRYIVLDAQPTLAKLCPDGGVSPQLFKSVISPVIADAQRANRRVRVFGEVVALLCDEGNFEAAIQLEELWNDLLRQHPFKLMCAYPRSTFAERSLGEPLLRVCDTHTHVVPCESYTTLTAPDDKTRYIAHLQQKASALESEIAENARLNAQLQQELRRSEELLLREQIARSEAETANRMKDDFLSTVSHELRTPLNAILGWSHLLRNGRLNEKTATQAIEIIERNARSQAQVVEDILDVSRMITGKLTLNIGLVDIAAVINAAIDSVQLAADSKQINLQVQVDPAAGHVWGDASRLQQVVWNLVSNAIKFTPPGGQVAIKVEQVDGDIEIRVSDTGLGIHSDYLACVFDRFRQIDASSTRRYGGLGLGLAVVRHLVELHGGTVAVESLGEGLGATFIITLRSR